MESSSHEATLCEGERLLERLAYPSTAFASFEEACCVALSLSQPLYLVVGGDEEAIVVDETIHVKTNGATLHIIGQGAGAVGRKEGRSVIQSSGHCIFQVGGRNSCLRLEHLELLHTCERQEAKDVGAVIFALHKAKVEVRDCSLKSVQGFAIWAVQSSTVMLQDCPEIQSLSRSGCVVFGHAQLSLQRCTITQCPVHGLCARGSSSLTMQSCLVDRCGKRGVYVYNEVTLACDASTFSNMRSSLHAAIDVSASASSSPSPSPSSSSSRQQNSTVRLFLTNCKVIDNEGYGLRVCGVGAVEKRVDAATCVFLNNRQGDELFLLESAAKEEDQEASQARIDESEGGGKGGESVVVWEYEVDDPAAGTQSATEAGWKRGWVRFDHGSQNIIETACLSRATLKHKEEKLEVDKEEVREEEESKVVYIQEGKYCIDLVKMEQTNVETFYSRAIRRRVQRNEA